LLWNPGAVARKTKASSPPPAPRSGAAPPIGYPAWKARVREMLEQAEVPAGTLRERDLRDLFIRNATPEQAAEQAGVTAHNARPTFGRQPRR
jgi:hypothetical protein